ncbi:MAG: hypothetical protein ACI9DC_001657 [Gammaproteobacteria bacterium]|jgi:hypothetical protein
MSVHPTIIGCVGAARVSHRDRALRLGLRDPRSSALAVALIRFALTLTSGTFCQRRFILFESQRITHQCALLLNVDIHVTDCG